MNFRALVPMYNRKVSLRDRTLVLPAQDGLLQEREREGGRSSLSGGPEENQYINTRQRPFNRHYVHGVYVHGNDYSPTIINQVWYSVYFSYRLGLLVTLQARV